MKHPTGKEFEDFDDTMSKLLRVPRGELQKKLDDEKDTKKEKKQPKATSSSGRASSKGS